MKRLQEQVELKERLTALGEMSAGIAHELRNPMAVIAGYLSLLAKKQDDAGQTVIRDIQAEIGGMNRIISDLLTFARPTPLNRTSVDMRLLLESCVETVLQARSARPPISTMLEIAAGTAPVDEVLMRQALGDEIITLGRETADTLIAMCSHGRTGTERWALGSWTLPSFTETVVRHANQPVLMVRAE